MNQSVTCTWCSTYYAARPATTNCANCGGPLPKGRSMERGSKPENAPRFLPKKFINQVMYFKNTHALIGIVFMIIGTPFILAFGFGLIFVIIGYFLFKHGKKIGTEKINALTNGISTEGKIIDISKDTSQTINGRNPFVISYIFETKDGSEQTDNIVCWNENNEFRQINEEIWVVYIRENPQISSPWPPIV